MKIIKNVLGFLFVMLIVIQFFKPTKNISGKPQPAAITSGYAVPAKVQMILNKACNDCHSNNTSYPWYNTIQPVAWWLEGHIEDGKRGLNFDEFTRYKLSRQFKRMGDIEEMVNDGSMPLSSYTWIHRNAILNPAEKEALVSWSKAVRDTMKVRYPADSLIRKS